MRVVVYWRRHITGALMESALTGHSGDTVRGKPPPFTVPHVEHADYVVVLEWIEQ